MAVQLAACCVCFQQTQKGLQKGTEQGSCAARNRKGSIAIRNRDKGVQFRRRLQTRAHGTERAEYTVNIAGDPDTEVAFRIVGLSGNSEFSQTLFSRKFLGRTIHQQQCRPYERGGDQELHQEAGRVE